MLYNKITAAPLAAITGVIGEGRVITGGDDFEKYSHDETEDLHLLLLSKEREVIS